MMFSPLFSHLYIWEIYKENIHLNIRVEPMFGDRQMTDWYTNYKNLLESEAIIAPEPGKDSMIVNDVAELKPEEDPIATDKPKNDRPVISVVTEDDETDEPVHMLSVSEPFLNAVINAAVDSMLDSETVAMVVHAMEQVEKLENEEDAVALMDVLRGKASEEVEEDGFADKEEILLDDEGEEQLDESVIGFFKVDPTVLDADDKHDDDDDILSEIRRRAGLSI